MNRDTNPGTCMDYPNPDRRTLSCVLILER